MGDKFGDRKLAVWDTKTKQQVFSVWVNDRIIPALSPDGRRVAAVVPERPQPGKRGDSIKIWEVSGDKEPLEVETTSFVEKLAFTADGKQLFLLRGYESGPGVRTKPGAKSGNDDFPIQVAVVDPTTGKELRKQEVSAHYGQEPYGHNFVRYFRS